MYPDGLLVYQTPMVIHPTNIERHGWLWPLH